MASYAGKIGWSFDDRLTIHGMLKEGYSTTEIRKVVSCSPTKLLSEIKKGTTEQEFQERRYIKYDPYKAIENDVISVIGEDAFTAILEIKLRELEK